MRPALLMLHGWGLDATLWDGVCAALPDFETIRWDRGYFGKASAIAPDRSVVAIGHSLGAMLFALDPPPPMIALIAINGFDRFAGEDAVPLRTVDRMRARFDEAPYEVLNAFRDRIGAGPIAATLDADRLADDLLLLATADARQSSRPPTLVLQGGADPLLPAAMRDAVFAGAARDTLAEGGHLLSITHPAWCAEQIRAFAA